MTGIVVVTHNNIGKAMVETARKILSDYSNIAAVSIDSDQSPEVSKNAIQEAIRSVDGGSGIILLTDMFGGTPTNICLSFLEKGKIEVISGVNLPMIIKLANIGESMNLDELTSFIKQYGQKNIVIASNILEGKVEY